ncbi:putative membrane protein [Geodermatophilus bullaregiensis]|uniref:phage holin family protein n=1 Tax=Geodermatophilus bullaregiensis TaxID=1564160 RepID=UPI001956D808|nr:phage holin family protein [Geodermatophilus bullaregiensis]MBM7806502.1 putative membrane protein [Geodermatophilus bullaregiensis]
MIRFALKVVITALAFYGLTRLLTGIDVVGNEDAPLGITGTFLWVALLFALVNAVVGPILRFLSFPAILLTLGLFLVVVNAALLGLTAAISDRLSVDGFGTAVLGGLVLAVVGWAADTALDRRG